ncbi:hypothetical protein [Ideonella sp. A 288]|uniref:hypothetical protein n=1 Tax=Ideonella sp. A 288 TaxID=1962181 RepID=UPI001185EA2B|nr:hypothetical protein [Ideonella sp. A 288]
MYTDLAVFSNAFDSPADLPVVQLVGPDLASLTKREAARQIERWQTQALTQALFNSWQVSNGYQLEQKLMTEISHLDFQIDRPRLFHRMLASGEPAVLRELARNDSSSAPWIRRALSRAPEVEDLLYEPTWRLLDPTPMSHIEWHLAAETMQRLAMSVLERREKFAAWVVELPIDQEGREALEYFIPRSHGSSRWGLLLTLLQLRRWEVHGNLIAYYLQLLEVIERCIVPVPDPDFAFMLPALKDYLTACFSRIHVGPTHPGNVEYQLARLMRARKAFIVVRGDLASGEPSVIRSNGAGSLPTVFDIGTAGES